MPHVNSSGGDDLASTDEVKVYKDEGEEEKRSSENLSEDKLGLVTESEEGKSSDIEGRSYPDEKGSSGPQDGKIPENPLFPGDRLCALGYPPMITPYPYPNGASLGPFGSKPFPSPPPGLAPFYMYPPNDHFSPPPAHMGIPPVHVDPKTGLPRPMYGIPPPGQLHPLYQELAQWPGHPGYPISAAGLRSPYGGSPLARFSPGMLPHGLSHLPPPAIVTPGPKQDIHSLLNGDSHLRQHAYFPHPDHHGHHHNGMPPSPELPKSKQLPKIKKPLNAFMLFMKEKRQEVIEECTLKESAAINQILGRRWHALDRGEQAKYYEMARKEKELHQQLYPGWSARDNYAQHAKKKKRKREPSNGENRGFKNGERDDWSDDCTNAKKCRARFGLDQQTQWCKPCRRKKKCIRFMEDGGINSNGEDDDDDDQLHSVGTVHSTTEGESELGSPTPSSTTTSHLDENRNQHPEISQSNQKSPPISKRHLGPMDIDVVGPYHHHGHAIPQHNSSYPSLPPLHRPIPLRDGRPHHMLASETVSCPGQGLSTPSASVSSSTMVLAS